MSEQRYRSNGNILYVDNKYIAVLENQRGAPAPDKQLHEITRACNAYGPLVKFVRNVRSSNIVDSTVSEFADQLLKYIGEDTP